jgi:hypothetical protein
MQKATKDIIEKMQKASFDEKLFETSFGSFENKELAYQFYNYLKQKIEKIIEEEEESCGFSSIPKDLSDEDYRKVKNILNGEYYTKRSYGIQFYTDSIFITNLKENQDHLSCMLRLYEKCMTKITVGEIDFDVNKLLHELKLYWRYNHHLIYYKLSKLLEKDGYCVRYDFKNYIYTVSLIL